MDKKNRKLVFDHTPNQNREDKKNYILISLQKTIGHISVKLLPENRDGISIQE